MSRAFAVSVATIGSILLLRSAADVRSFAYTQRGHTGGGETIARDAGVLRGDMALGKDRVHYEGRVAPDGTVPRLEIRASRAGARADAARIITVTFGRDSMQIVERRGNEADTLRLPSAAGTLPYIDPSMGLIEPIVARARSQKSSVKVPIVLIDALNLTSTPSAPLRSRANVGVIEVTFVSADTAMLGNGHERDKMRVVVGADGHVRGAVSGADAKDPFAIRPTTKPAPRGE